MGLDMYLKKVPKLHGNATKIDLINLDPSELQRSNPTLYLYLKPHERTVGSEYIKWQSYSTEVAYWRKANHIHAWFVDCVQNGIDECEYSLVTKTQLQTLLDKCRTVLQNPEQAKDLLPTRNGFLFGCTDYDESYFIDIKNTITMIERVFDETDFDSEELYYRSSW